MINRRINFRLLSVAALALLCLPAFAAAQGSYGPVYSRDTDDRYYQRGYDRHVLRDAIHRVKDLSKDFEKEFDRSLDHSPYEETRAEDRFNAEAREFHRAAERLKDRFGDGRDLYRSEPQARDLLATSARLDRIVSHAGVDSRAYYRWAEIRHDLRIIADAYGFRGRDYDDAYYRR